MASDASIADSRPRPSHVGNGHLESVENTQPLDRPPSVRSCPLINQDVVQNVDARITHLTTVISQMVGMLNQVNGVPIPSVMQELSANIPQPYG